MISPVYGLDGSGRTGHLTPTRTGKDLSLRKGTTVPGSRHVVGKASSATKPKNMCTYVKWVSGHMNHYDVHFRSFLAEISSGIILCIIIPRMHA